MRAGSELYIRDIALELLARGHEPIAYSRNLGQVALELREASVLVVDDLTDLSQPPDIIHAQHHLETVTALTRYPNVPALCVCHGWLPSQEAPLEHPRIHRYLAVDKLVEERLVQECGIASKDVFVCLNFVDLKRFRQRPHLPKKAKRALVFSNYIDEGNVLPALRTACTELGLSLDICGSLAGTAHAKPEELLGEYDIVFAKGRAALEAAAVGAAVIVCDAAGIGQMTTSANLRHFRDYNFGLRLLRDPVTVEAIKAQVNRFDSDDTLKVTSAIRAEIGLSLAVDKLLEHYQATISAHQQAVISAEDEARALSHYLRYGPILSDFSRDKTAELNQQIGQLQVKAQHSASYAQSLKSQVEHLEHQVKKLEAQQTNLTAVLNSFQSQNRRLQSNVRKLELLKATIHDKSK